MNEQQEMCPASPELNDLNTVKFLLCYLLYKLERDITVNQLYDICVNHRVINYFFYQDALDALLENGALLIANDASGNETIVITAKGLECAKEFRTYIPRYFRRLILTEAITYFYNEKIKSEVIVEYIKLSKGWHVHVRCLDIGDDLLEMKMYAPDEKQAKLIGNKIALNPVAFYGNILGFVLDNEPVKIKLDDI